MKILFAGDFCPRNRVLSLFDKGHYSEVLQQVKRYTVGVDYAIVNFESAIITGSEKHIDKIGGIHGCSCKGLEAVRYAGFNVVTLANNHIKDFGEEGVLNVLDQCDRLGLNRVGAGKNSYDASKILYTGGDGTKLAIINACEREFSIATEHSAGANHLNPVSIYYSILEARKNSDVVIVIVHGGTEHYQLPTPRMVQLYRYLIDVGADAVVNHHQHCYGGYEIYHGKPIFYGLGNFCFDRGGDDGPTWNYGYMVELEFLKDGINYHIYPYYQCGKDPVVDFLPEDSFADSIMRINGIIANPEDLQRHYQKYLDDYCPIIKTVLQPFTNRYIVGLLRRNLFPFMASKKNLLRLKGYIQCETHMEKLFYYLKVD